MVHSLIRRASVAVLVGSLSVPAHGRAQTSAPSSSLRYGSGLFDVPIAAVLPHLGVTASFSGFFVDLPGSVEIDAAGDPVTVGPGVESFHGDAAVNLGLFDRFEVGGSLQSLSTRAEGGSIWGLFGQLRLLRPAASGLGLAVGARFVSSPDFGDGVAYAPGRLGFPDARLRDRYAGKAGLSTGTTLYGVATATVAGLGGGPLPDHDLEVSFGYGTGMFREGGSLDFYRSTHSNGWFAGAALHVEAGRSSVASLMAEYNGFDVNVGARLDLGGLRVGAHLLGVNHAEPPGGFTSEYRSPKFGFTASLALCPGGGGLCRSGLRASPEPDTIWIPAPPPDTVVVREPAASRVIRGQALSLCLASGETVRVGVTELGDTLVGPDAISLASLGEGVVLAGTYAQGAPWWVDGGSITLDGTEYLPGESRPVADCSLLERVGEWNGVPLFAARTEGPPADRVLFVPLRPGTWQIYRPAGSGPGGVSPPGDEEISCSAGARGETVRHSPQAHLED